MEQQLARWVGRVMDGATDVEFDFTAGEVVGYFVGVPEETGQAVEFGNDERLSSPARGDGFA